MDAQKIADRLKTLGVAGVIRVIDSYDASRPDPNAPIPAPAHPPAAPKPAAPAAPAAGAAPAGGAAPVAAATPAPAPAPKPVEHKAPEKPKSFGDEHLWVEAKHIVPICKALRDDAQLRFEMLISISGCDYDKAAPNFSVVYHLISMTNKMRLTVRADIPKAKPEIDTVELIWPAANWHERETYDFYGIVFTGHSDLRRILLADDWAGWPMRKDYVYPTEYHGISCV